VPGVILHFLSFVPNLADSTFCGGVKAAFWAPGMTTSDNDLRFISRLGGISEVLALYPLEDKINSNQETIRIRDLSEYQKHGMFQTTSN
jgi:hypothetical protein